MDKIVIFIVAIIVLVGGIFWASQSGVFVNHNVPPTPLPEGIVLFFGEACPHCVNVEKFITDNNVDSKVKITRLEVPFALKTSPQLVANAELAIKQAQVCKLDVSNGVSLPFLWDGKNCIIGDQPVIDFLKTQVGIK